MAMKSRHANLGYYVILNAVRMDGMNAEGILLRSPSDLRENLFALRMRCPLRSPLSGFFGRTIGRDRDSSE